MEVKSERTESAGTGEILKSAAKALTANDSTAFADRLIELVKAEPKRWTSLLLMAGIGAGLAAVYRLFKAHHARSQGSGGPR